MPLGRALLALSTTLLLAAPVSAAAMQAQAWNFLADTIPGEWMVNGSQPLQTENGMRLQASGELRMIRRTDFHRSVDAIRITFGPSTGGDLTLMWHERGTPPQNLVQLPVTMTGGPTSMMEVNLRNYAQWDPKADVFGLALPSGADVTIQRIEFLHWNPLEKLWYGLRSFWFPDNFRVYSINFLWGPILTFNPIGLSQMFTSLPPPGWSANRVFYGIFLITILVLTAHRYWAGGGRAGWKQSLTTFLAVFVAVWIVFDLRMGMEILHYAKQDVLGSLLQPPGQKHFRNYGNLYDVIDQSLPELTAQPKYVFLGPPKTPFLSITRYITYPKSVPVQEEESVEGIKTWLIYGRPDITVGSGHLLLGTSVIANGDIIKRFDDTSFLFQVR